MDIAHVTKHLSLDIDTNTLKGDRVRLPPSLLNELLNINGENTSLPQPFTFVLSRGRRRVYVSVQEFTTEEATITVGPAIANALEAEAGDTIHIKWVVLEKGEAVKLVPLSEAYLSIQDIRYADLVGAD